MSSETNSYFKSIKIVSFNGKQSDWQKWSLKLLVNASVRGYKGILLGTDVAPTDSEEIDLSTDVGKNYIDYVKRTRKHTTPLYLVAMMK